MPSKNAFRSFVALTLLLEIVGDVYDVFSADEITQAVLAHYAQIEPEPLDLLMSISSAAATLGAALCIASFIGLLALWNPARHLYAASVIAFIPITAFFGTTVSSGMAAAILYASNVLAGVLLALLYWSPAKLLFTDKTG